MQIELDQLKAANRAPQWLNEEGLATLNKGYLLPNETPIGLYKRLARTASAYLGKDFYEPLCELLFNGWFSPSTPAAANFGTLPEHDRGLPVSCYGSTPANSIHSIYDKAKEIALLSKHGGGIGVGIGELKGITSAAIWASIYDQVFTNVSQGKTRRGSGAVYVPYRHPDLLDILNAKDLLAGADKRVKLDCNIAVCFDDADLERIFSQPTEHDLEAMDAIARLRMSFGSPYIQFTDNALKALPECYKTNGLSFKHSNLCLLGDELIVTSEGPARIDSLHGKSVSIFDGKQWQENSSFRLIGQEAELIELKLRSGYSLRVTLDHTIYADGKAIKAKDAKPGMLLEVHEEQSHGDEMLAGAYAKGFMIGDGCYAYLAVYKPKYSCLSKLEQSIAELPRIEKTLAGSCMPKKCRLLSWSSPKQAKSGFTGLFTSEKIVLNCPKTYDGLLQSSLWKTGLPQEWLNWDAQSKLELIAGLFDADASGYAKASGYCKYQLGAKSRKLLSDVQLMLRTLGIESILIADGGRLDITGKSAYKLAKSAPFQRLPKLAKDHAPSIRFKQKNAERIKSANKILLGEPVNVYCTTVPSTGKFALVHGSMTGNCSEIFLHSDEDHTYVCVLSSLVLSRLAEYADIGEHGISFNEIARLNGISWTAPMLAIAFLDAVCQEFIIKASNIKGIECAVRSAEKGRPLGLGVLGWHTLLQKLGLPFDCEQSSALNIAIFKELRSEAEKATAYLAAAKGEPEWCKGFNRRNTHLLALAPTMSNSVLCNGGSASIEPIKSNLYSFEGSKGIFIRRNEQLAKSLAELGCNNNETWQSIANNNGSIQHLPLPGEIKAVYRTAMEISQEAIIKQAADRQKYIDQGQSLNLFLPPDIASEEFWRLHWLAWKSGLKSLYYVRSKSLLIKDTTMVPSTEANIAQLKTRSNCSWCVKTKALLKKHNIGYEEQQKLAGPVPEILFKGKHLSYSELLAMLEPAITEPSECEACSG